MKLRKSHTTREGPRTKVYATFTNRFRVPASLEIKWNTEAYEATKPILDDDTVEVAGLLNGLAEIAWANGWRPRGLAGTLVRVVETYREPSDVGV